MRRIVSMNSLALCCDRTMRSSVWQPTQFNSPFFCWSLPGTLAIHSAFDNWAARSSVLPSVRSAVEDCATSTSRGPLSS
jgi:hypothetical protein